MREFELGKISVGRTAIELKDSKSFFNYQTGVGNALAQKNAKFDSNASGGILDRNLFALLATYVAQT